MAAGFARIEIFEQDFLSSGLSRSEVGQMVRDKSLAITRFQPFRDFEGLPGHYRDQAFARDQARVAAAQCLSPAPWPQDQQWSGHVRQGSRADDRVSACAGAEGQMTIVSV